MKTKMKFKRVVFSLVAAGALALSANAQAVSLDAGVFATGAGDAANPIVFNVLDPGNPGPSGGQTGFTDTIQFDLGSFTHFNMTSSVNNILFFGSTIFENKFDTEIPLGNGYAGGAPTFTSVLLPNLGETRDYHLHPQGVEGPGASAYTLTLWGSNAAPVPLPAAAWLFGSGVIGLIGFARRKMKATA